MCQYYKKISTCGHLSNVYIDRCALASRADASPCTSNSHDHDPVAFQEAMNASPRPSFFECFECICAAAHCELDADPKKREELEANRDRLQAEHDADEFRQKYMKKEGENVVDPDEALQKLKYMEAKDKLEANRKLAEEKMAAERAADAAKAQAAKLEKEREARGEGAWHQASGGSGRKNKEKRGGRGMGRNFSPSPSNRGGENRGPPRNFSPSDLPSGGRNGGANRGGGGASHPGSPSVPRSASLSHTAPPTPTFPMGVHAGIGGRAGKMGEFRHDEPRSANELEGGGKTGVWGLASKQILRR